MGRYLLICLGIGIITVGFFFLGFKVGLFLFLNNTLIDVNKNINEHEYNLDVNQSVNQSESALEENLPEENFCAEGIEFLNENDKRFCFQKPKLTESRGLEVNLTANKALLYEQGRLIKIFPLFYQAPEDRWFQAPTGYYRTGIKREKHLSSLFSVIMPYSIQYYEDFFIHGIPYYKDGNNVSSNFTGGCLRFDNEVAKEIYNFLRTGDQIIVYKTFDDLKIKPQFSPPVDLNNYWIRQRFLNPYRKSWKYGGTENLKLDYDQHAGLDLAPNQGAKDLSVYAIYDGQVAKIQRINDGRDHGLGNTVILKHQINNKEIYSLYAHLSSIKNRLKEGDIIKQGEIIGEVGNSGYGCENYWRVGPDGCESAAPPDIHLHFEMRKMLDSEYFGYTPDYPQKYGYLDPIQFLFEKLANKP